MTTWDIDIRRLPVSKLSALAAVAPRASRMADVLGLRPLADLLGTDAANLKNAIAGKRELPAHIARRALDLDHVLARALQVFPPQVVLDWLVGSEPFLGNARPIDVLALEGASRLLDALDGIEAGAYP